MIPISVTVGPLATADADGVCLSQTAPAAGALALNGALTAGFDADAFATAQAVAAAGDLTLDGALTQSGVGYMPTPGYVTVTSAGDDSGITFTVKGMLYGAGGPAYQSETITGANTSVVSTTVRFHTVTAVTASDAAAGNVSVGTNGVATMDMARRVRITSAGNDSGITFTITGTDWNNNAVTETVTGANASTADSTRDFLTITKIVASGATANAVTIGTNGVASSRPIRLDEFGSNGVSQQVTVTGTVSFTVQQSLDDPEDVGLSSVTWLSHADSDFVNGTASAQSNYAYTPLVSRILLNSGTGTVVYTLIQPTDNVN